MRPGLARHTGLARRAGWLARGPLLKSGGRLCAAELHLVVSMHFHAPRFHHDNFIWHRDKRGDWAARTCVPSNFPHHVSLPRDLRHVKQAARAARLVMEKTSHTLLVGLQSTQFALDMGLPVADLSTKESLRLYRNWWVGGGGAGQRGSAGEDGAVPAPWTCRSGVSCCRRPRHDGGAIASLPGRQAPGLCPCTALTQEGQQLPAKLPA